MPLVRLLASGRLLARMMRVTGSHGFHHAASQPWLPLMVVTAREWSQKCIQISAHGLFSTGPLAKARPIAKIQISVEALLKSLHARIGGICNHFCIHYSCLLFIFHFLVFFIQWLDHLFSTLSVYKWCTSSALQYPIVCSKELLYAN